MAEHQSAGMARLAGTTRNVISILAIVTATPSLATVVGEWQVTLRQGATMVPPLAIGATAEAAHQACVARIPSTAAARTEYSCDAARYVATVTPNPCPPPPPVQTRPANCPTGTVGTFQQTGVSTYGPPPACTLATTWAPTTPPAGSCPAQPPPILPAPTNLVALGTDPLRIRVTWDAVPGASAYVFDRCILPSRAQSCAPYFMSCVRSNSVTHGPFQSAGLSVMYRVRASKDATCSAATGNLGAYSATVRGVALSAPVPIAGQAQLRWTAPTRNTDGSVLTNLASFRINYGRSADQLTSVVDVPSSQASAYTVTNLAAGTWFFAVKAVTSAGTESAPSNVVSKEVL